MSLLNLGSAAGFIALGALAWGLGGFRRPFPRRTVAGGVLLLLVLATGIFAVPGSRRALVFVNDAVLALLDAGNTGARFLFGPLALSRGAATAAGEPSIGFVMAAQVLPAVIFFAALMAALYHLRVVQPVVRLFARLFHRALGLSGAEALAGAANVFVGVESAVVVRPYLETMTRSELLCVLSCGMATVASTTLAIYVTFLSDSFPLIAGHLVSASILAIPASAIAAKLILPEDGQPTTAGAVPPAADEGRQPNLIAALGAGAWDGLRLAAGIATLLIAILGLLAVVDLLLVRAGPGLDLERVVGWVFTPLAWLLGLDGADVVEAGRLLGTRAIATEVVAYRRLGELAAAGTIAPRSVLVLSYALCGFAHVASVGIFVGGTAAIAPSRRGDLSALGIKAFLAATLGTLMTGAIAGAFFQGQAGLVVR